MRDYQNARINLKGCVISQSNNYTDTYYDKKLQFADIFLTLKMWSKYYMQKINLVVSSQLSCFISDLFLQKLSEIYFYFKVKYSHYLYEKIAIF